MLLLLFLNHDLTLLLHSLCEYPGVLHTWSTEIKQDSVGLKLTVNLKYFTESGSQNMCIGFLILLC